ncbi:hypothetical protein [Endozoicomonas sp. GU-1]|uniref:hypothetical protein n=1 Tax=Endozoicomonas sp. GU-1 TaxID=3009078 RepID=UPI0022B5AC48|nr:hypothetical protein [Endozoicomonas sp. GU-1]WBA81196.1 hypothetical protein O2T12_23355 [Endozoicomonas sp. GU-1]WBA84144.1 hypothetical protein O3276_12535 [Endozoicomonas sp. GU-1]
MLAVNKDNNSSEGINSISDNLGNTCPDDTSASPVFWGSHEVKLTQVDMIIRYFENQTELVKRQLCELGLPPLDRKIVSNFMINNVATVLQGTAPQIGIAEMSPSANGCNNTVNAPNANEVALTNQSVGKNQSLPVLNNSDCEVSFRLFDAFQAGNAQLVIQYCRQILGSPRDEWAKQTLLEARNPADIPGLYVALKKGHTDCISAFFDQVQCSNLNLEVKQKLLAPQVPSNNTPGLFLAMRTGHAGLARAYCEWILSTNNPDCWKEEQLMAIDLSATDELDRPDSQAPALHEAMEKNHSACVKVFCKLVLASNLSVQIKENLIAAKHVVCPWRPGLYSAFFKGNAHSVEAFCQQVLEAKLDDSVKHRLLASKWQGATIIKRANSRSEVFQKYKTTIKDSNLNCIAKASLTSRIVPRLKITFHPVRLFLNVRDAAR